MLFLLGIGCVVALQSSIVINLMEFLRAWGWRIKFWQVAAICCFNGFLVGLIYITPGGQWILTLVDHFGANFVIFALVILQMIGIMWIYGVENFSLDVEFMLKKKVSVFLKISWLILTPLMMMIIFIYSMVKFENPTYMSREFPTSCIIAGWILFSFGIAQVMISAIWMTLTRNGEEKKDSAMKYLLKINPDWGPKDSETREEWISFKKQKFETRQMQAVGHSKLKQINFMLLGKYN